MKIIQWIKVKFRKLRDNKVDAGPRQVLAERNSLKDQLSEAKRKIADLENMARAQESLNHQVSHGKKEENDGKDKEIEPLEGELGIKNSLTDQQSVGEQVIKQFEHRIQSKDEKIRLLQDELAMEDEEIQRLKSQQDRREEEYTKLRNSIQSAYIDMENAVVTLGSVFSKIRVKNRPQKGIDYRYDLIGAQSSAEGYTEAR
ncbi:hypothetical protein OIU79_029309 [Salix purpurea]|uniref:Uncharacterized protein n=1 Tax=Salix purpurea TaxID=77065 RepID=A0A9Q0VG83_SALPP|nr:hypothetical protein OIU79_029309 [Salix purpurea]KAJ6748157.1 hypothetical protein OIU79_029309 [Salix purpurea]